VTHVVDERDPERRYFGHYQALDPLDGAGEAPLWHAWDPYLGRYVVIASLGHIDPEVLRSSLGDLDGALRRWTGVSAFHASDVWHFFAGDGVESPFIVLAPSGQARGSAEDEPRIAALPLLAAVPAVQAAFAAWPGRLWGALALALLMVVLIPLTLFMAAANRSDRDTPVVSAVVVALSTPTLGVEPTATMSPEPTPTSSPVAASRRPAAAQPRVAEARKKEGAAAPAPVPPARARPSVDSADSIVRGIRPGEVVALPGQMVGAVVLVRDWLVQHCLQVEQQYLEAGQTFACGWRGVAIEGSLPEVTATFTQIDRHMQTGRDLHTGKRVRLLCTDRCVALEQETSVVEVY